MHILLGYSNEFDLATWCRNYTVESKHILVLVEHGIQYSICERTTHQRAQKKVPDLGGCFGIGVISWVNSLGFCTL